MHAPLHSPGHGHAPMPIFNAPTVQPLLAQTRIESGPQPAVTLNRILALAPGAGRGASDQ